MNGFFSMSEIAVVSSRKSKLESDSKQGSKKAKNILDVLDNPDKFLSTIQIAITTIGLIIGLYTGESYVEKFADILRNCSIDDYLSTIISRVCIVFVETFFMLVFGELLPKRIGMSNPEKVASIIISPMRVLKNIFSPLVWLLSVTTSFISKIFGIDKVKHSQTTEDEIKSIIDDSAEQGEIEKTEQDIATRVFDLSDRKVESLMTPRNELAWVEQNEKVRDLAKKVVRENVHTIYPVCDKSLDNIVGVFSIKDMFPVTSNKIDYTFKDIMHQPQFFHESVSIYNILESFKQTKIHYAFIVDEFGMVQGMITMNDILEALVGNSSELELENEEQEFIKRDDGTYIVDGQYPFYDFLSHFSMEDDYQKYPYNTLSGLILALTGRIPKEGEKITWQRFTFEIIDMDSIRIDKILVTENKPITKETE